MVTTLESMVARFRRAIGDGSASFIGKTSATELEIRFQSVDYDNFATILKALVEKKNKAVLDGEVQQSTNAIMEERVTRAPRTADASHRASRPQRLRQITYVGGKRTSDKFTVKAPLMPPFRVANPTALPYSVALSSESDDPTPFSSDEGAIIRVKARVGFPYSAPSPA